MSKRLIFGPPVCSPLNYSLLGAWLSKLSSHSKIWNAFFPFWQIIIDLNSWHDQNQNFRPKTNNSVGKRFNPTLSHSNFFSFDGVKREGETRLKIQSQKSAQVKKKWTEQHWAKLDLTRQNWHILKRMDRRRYDGLYLKVANYALEITEWFFKT